jgi:hypothetical protein
MESPVGYSTCNSAFYTMANTNLSRFYREEGDFTTISQINNKVTDPTGSFLVFIDFQTILLVVP